MNWQVELIKNSFYCFSAENNLTELCFGNSQNNLTFSELDTKRYLHTATEIVENVLKRSMVGNINGHSSRTFLGCNIQAMEIDCWRTTPLSVDLYNGRLGIVVLFCALYLSTKECKYLSYANHTIESVVVAVLNDVDFKYSGFFEGIGGILFAMNYLYKITKEERLKTAMLHMLSKANKYIENDSEHDYIGGNVGLLVALLKINSFSDDDDIRRSCIEVSNYVFSKLYTRFETKTLGNLMSYSGYAHGTAGISASIYRYYKVTANEQALEFFNNIMNYERRAFINGDNEQWRSSVERGLFSVKGWCHGNSGLLLNRILLKEHGYHDELIDSEVKQFLESTLTDGFGANLSYCHGDIGNLMIVKYAAKILNNEALYEKCDLVFADLYRKSIKNILSNEKIFTGKLFGLMLGLSGVAFSLIKFYDYNLDDFFII